MKNLLILGAGTSGTMMANHLRSKLNKNQWNISIVDQYKTHYYQPGFLFLPFDTYTENQVKKVGKNFIPKGVNYIQKKIEKIHSKENKVELEDETLNYDILIIATGSKIAPEETEGLIGPLWKKDIFDYQREILRCMYDFKELADLDTPELRRERKNQVEQKNNRVSG